MQNETPLWKFYAFPALGLVADIALIVFRGMPDLIWLIAAAVTFIVPCAMIPASNANADDNMKSLMAVAAAVPVLIIGFATS